MAFVDEALISALMQTVRISKTTGAQLLRQSFGWCPAVSLADVKAHGNITHSIQDTDLSGKLLAATVALENVLGLGFVEQTWKETYDRVTRGVELSIGPVLSVASINIVPNFDAETQTLVAASSYIVHGKQILARDVWPTHRGWQSFEVLYKVGYVARQVPNGDDDEDTLTAQAAVPADLQLALKELTLFFYENREGQGYDASFAASIERGVFPPMVDQLIKPYIEWGV